MKEQYVQLVTSEPDHVVISVYHKINSITGDAVEAELFRIRKTHPQGQLILDFGHLEYLSSRGLRILVKLQMAEKQTIRLEQVHDSVADVLAMSGLDRMLDVHKALRKMDVSMMELIGQGANGKVYRIDDESIIKVFPPAASLDIVERERRLAQEALLSGIPTAISQSVVETGSGYGIVFEMINAGTLSAALSENPDRFDELTGKYVELYRIIHQTKGNMELFPSAKTVNHRNIDACREWYTEEEIEKLHILVDSIPDRDTMLHGDFHPNNIMLLDNELILIDMGDMSIGHPVFDFLATASTQVNLVSLSPEYAEKLTKMPAELIRRTWRKLIDTYFADQSASEKARIEEQIVLLSKLRVALAPVYGLGAAPEIIQASVEDARSHFIPETGRLIGAIDW